MITTNRNRLKIIIVNLIILFLAFNMSYANLFDGNTKSLSYYTNEGNSKIEFIVFGIYCGECTEHCATMFKYNFDKNKETLLVDTTDSFFSNYLYRPDINNMVFQSVITDENKILLAQTILNKIPRKLLFLSASSKEFGCPDCADGCGIYFELKVNNRIKKFYIDYEIKKLNGSIRQFAIFLKSTIKELEQGLLLD